MAYPAVDSRAAGALLTGTHRDDARGGGQFTGMEGLATAAQNVETTIGVLVEIDVGMARTGVSTAAGIVEMAQLN